MGFPLVCVIGSLPLSLGPGSLKDNMKDPNRATVPWVGKPSLCSGASPANGHPPRAAGATLYLWREGQMTRRG